MIRKRISFSLLLIGVLFISACGAANQAAAPANTPTAEVMAEKEEMAGDEAMAEKEEMAGDEAMMEQEEMAEASPTHEAMADEAMAETEKMAGDEAMMEQEAVAEASPTPEAMASEAMAEKEEMAGDEAMVEKETMADLPAWFEAELTDVNSGQNFKIADFQGKVVLVETLAVWCPTCKRQQDQVKALHELLGEREDFVSLGLGIDPNEEAALLKAHTDQHGYGWRYAVSPPEVSREIAELYGAQFLNPPSTPMLIIDRQGQAHPLPFGVKDAQTLQEALAPYLEGQSQDG